MVDGKYRNLSIDINVSSSYLCNILCCINVNFLCLQRKFELWEKLT